MMRVGLIIALLAVAASAAARPDDYRFDPVHTQVFFSVSHVGFSHPFGRLHVKNGFIRFDADDWSTASVDAQIDIASLDMGDVAWNKKLLSPDFFDVARRSSARFVSTGVEKTGPSSGVVHGRLTLLGVTRPLDLAVTFNRAGVHPWTLRHVAGFSASATLKRSDFGMQKFLPEVGDEVTVRIEAEGLRDRNAQEQAEHSETEH